ncbi:MAG: dihydroorotate dehydrogenase (quinone) [Chloroflexi bacterium]|nr:dihydroorotate dehydrogenase (quinone) [Chloroflexota bacterium]
MGAYETFLRPLVFTLEPERAQALAEWGLRRRRLWRFLTWHYDRTDPRLRVQAAGLDFPSPVGLAAGYDKQCSVLDSLLALGFGYVVGGTVLKDPRPGNPKPRVLRLTRERALVNALGFPSVGMEAAAASLERLRGRLSAPGKPALVSVAGLTQEDFLECHARLEPLVDGVELNISSPNTRGLRVFQEPETLARLLAAVNAQRRKPLFVKLPPSHDPPSHDLFLSLLRVCKAQAVSGLTVANTRPVEAPALAMGRGGLSGPPLLADTLRMVTEARAEVGQGMAINACGGIATAEDALRALRAGADTVQLLTALVYQGPSVARRINRGLARMLDETGRASLGEMAGRGWGRGDRNDREADLV